MAAVEASAAAAVATLQADLRTSAEAAAATEASTAAAAAAALASYNAAMQHGAEDKNTCLAQLQAGTTSSSSCTLTHRTPPHIHVIPPAQSWPRHITVIQFVPNPRVSGIL